MSFVLHALALLPAIATIIGIAVAIVDRRDASALDSLRELGMRSRKMRADDVERSAA